MVRRFASKLYNWVAVMIVLGALLGHFYPGVAVKMQPLADGFINLIKMLIPPVILCSVVLGIAGAGSIKKAGRVGAKAILYFEVVSTFALVIGLIMANVFGPGRSFHADPSKLDPRLVAGYVAQAHHMTVTDHLLKMIPKTLFSAFTDGDILQVLLISVLLGFSAAALPEKYKAPLIAMLENVSKMFFGVMKQILYLAPIGAGAAIAFTIGKFGLKSLVPMAQLIGLFYATCALFVIVVLGTIARLAGFNIFKVLRYIKGELLLVLATSSSESALIPLMTKMEHLGLSKSIVGLVIPTGYSFNLDGTNIYMTLASIFIAQAMGIELTLGQQLGILVVTMITSKGAAGVTGSGFITLAATLAVVPGIPVAGMALILGIDKFMSEARAITNHIGNCLAAVLMAIWEKELDWKRFNEVLNRHEDEPMPEVALAEE
ncbi:C4-dicarboxylate transporter DctA [Mesoterricola silvestris]|uniref:C4-dicarboxylate transport protein n=1 Tax=Mesoterricola silvestris TaxID=2927979 RepID=A0AA48GHI7_9BACT|nr:C4-dicarboxylate transporter DctA [Mesoterricola silvestris]BDU71337.1 C4-dicarboxylate transport protein [Mesoterricola silvestris]